MIRPARETDAPAMATVLSDWIDEAPWMPRLHSRAEDLGFCQSLLMRADVWVADTRKGTGFLARRADSIEALYLAPSLRHAGWGKALIDAVRADRTRLTLWTFQANRAAIAFYEALGFHISDVTDGAGNAEKLPDCFMIWTRQDP